MTLDKLIDILQEWKGDLGGNTEVVVSMEGYDADHVSFALVGNALYIDADSHDLNCRLQDDY